MNSTLDGYFDVDPATVASCPKPKGGCRSLEQGFAQNPLGASFMHQADPASTDTSVSAIISRAMRDTPTSDTPPSMPNLAEDPPLPNVTFASDWTSKYEELTLTNQNGFSAPNGDLCCSYGATGAPPVCAAAIIKTGGTRYFDTTNQRYRAEQDGNTPGAGIVVDYKSHKHMFVGYRNGTEVTECKHYCPVDARDKLIPHFFGFHNRVVDRGAEPWQGHSAEHYRWVEKADPLPIPLKTIDLYADISDPAKAVPLFRRTALTPLGMKAVGWYNFTWIDFKAGAPNPKKFDIEGADTCPQASQCGAPHMQDERLALGMYHTWLRYA